MSALLNWATLRWVLLGGSIVAAFLFGLKKGTDHERMVCRDQMAQRELAFQTAERERQAQAQKDAEALRQQLTDLEQRQAETVREVIRTVRVLVPDQRACDLSAEAVDLINKVRSP